MNKKQFGNLLIVIIMLACLITAIMFYFQRNKDECTSNPLVFAAQLYEKNYDAKVYGTLTLMPPEGTKFVKPTNIFFNSTNYEVLE